VRLAVYSLLRLGLYGVCLGVLYLVGMRGWLLVLLPAFLAWGLSYVLLNGARDAAATQIAEAAERRRERGGRPDFGDKAREEEAFEDAVDDAARHESDERAGHDGSAGTAG
jgi:hypothetical protein